MLTTRLFDGSTTLRINVIVKRNIVETPQQPRRKTHFGAYIMAKPLRYPLDTLIIVPINTYSHVLGKRTDHVLNNNNKIQTVRDRIDRNWLKSYLEWGR